MDHHVLVESANSTSNKENGMLILSEEGMLLVFLVGPQGISNLFLRGIKML